MLLANIVTVRNVILLILLISNLNKKKSATKPLPSLVSLNTRRLPVMKRSSFVILHWFVRVKVPRNVKQSMNLSVKPGNEKKFCEINVVNF